MFALLRAWSALRNPGFSRPLRLSLSELLQSHLPPCIPGSHERDPPAIHSPFIHSPISLLPFSKALSVLS